MQRGAGPVSITRGKGTALGRTSKGATEGVHASHIVYKQASEYFYMICDQLKLNERALLLLRLACDPVPRLFEQYRLRWKSREHQLRGGY